MSILRLIYNFILLPVGGISLASYFYLDYIRAKQQLSKKAKDQDFNLFLSRVYSEYAVNSITNGISNLKPEAIKEAVNKVSEFISNKLI